MEKKVFLEKLNQIIEESRTGILATVSENGFPAMRYMTVTTVPGREGYLYSLTSQAFPKVRSLQENEAVSWLFTSSKTREVFSLRGKIVAIDNPRFKAEIMEDLGKALETFWKLDSDPADLVCLETKVLSGEYFNPKTAEKSQVQF